MNKSYVAACAAWMVVCLFANVEVGQAQSVPAPWDSSDIGAPVLGGSATYSDGVFTIDAAGEDVWGSSDQLHFVYQPVSGDIDVRARVDSLTLADEWSKAGIMIRGSLSANAAHGFALVSAGRGIAFQRRQTAGGLSTNTPGQFESAPRWVRLVRAATTISAFSSPDGQSWTMIGSDTVELGATVYVGIAVTSHNPDVRTTAVVSSVSMSSASIQASALSAADSSVDIGQPRITGSTQLASGRYTITAGGRGIMGSADQFRYVYRPVTGDVDVVARVESVRAVDRWSMAGVMLRESLTAGSRHAFVFESARRGYGFTYRAEPRADSQRVGGADARVGGWVRLRRTGAQVEGFWSADGTTWTKMGTVTIGMSETIYVGIAVTSSVGSTATIASVSGLDITNPGTTTNRPPAIILGSPANNATFVAPATVTITASATDPDGTIASVEFYANATLLGRDASAPFSFTASSLPAGMYELKAVATDNQGANALSDGVVIIVASSASETAPRWVAFQASADHATLVTKYVLQVYAANATPGTSTPTATSGLGKPTPSSTGEITVDRAEFFAALPPGNYLATVTAVGDGGSARSTAVSFSR